MSTRSAIAIMHGERAKSVYCHWDGYLEHNGFILQNFYDTTKTNKLISMGDISSLGAEIGDKHDFDERTDPETYADTRCTFYTRDRSEETTWKSFGSLDEMVDYYKGSWCEYLYVMRDGVWYYTSLNSVNLQPLKEALDKIVVDKEAV